MRFRLYVCVFLSLCVCVGFCSCLHYAENFTVGCNNLYFQILTMHIEKIISNILVFKKAAVTPGNETTSYI